MLTREQILGASDLNTERVDVPEWGGAVFVRPMTAAERDEYEQSMVASRGADEKANLRNVRARLVVVCATDEAGKRIFSETDVEALGAKSARAVNRVFQAASRLNALTTSDVEDLAKNSGAGRSADSPSN